MQQENDQNQYEGTQPHDAPVSPDASQQGTRSHLNANGDRTGWSDQTEGDPNQRGTRGHPQDESLRNRMPGSLGRDLSNRPGSRGQFNQAVAGARTAAGQGTVDDDDDGRETGGPFLK